MVACAQPQDRSTGPGWRTEAYRTARFCLAGASARVAVDVCSLLRRHDILQCRITTVAGFSFAWLQRRRTGAMAVGCLAQAPRALKRKGATGYFKAVANLACVGFAQASLVGFRAIGGAAARIGFARTG